MTYPDVTKWIFERLKLKKKKESFIHANNKSLIYFYDQIIKSFRFHKRLTKKFSYIFFLGMNNKKIYSIQNCKILLNLLALKGFMRHLINLFNTNYLIYICNVDVKRDQSIHAFIIWLVILKLMQGKFCIENSYKNNLYLIIFFLVICIFRRRKKMKKLKKISRNFAFSNHINDHAINKLIVFFLTPYQQ